MLLVFFLGSLFLGWYSQSLPSGPTASAVQEVHAVNSDVITGAGGETANGTEPPAQGPDSKGNGTASEEEPLRIGVLVAWWPPEWCLPSLSLAFVLFPRLVPTCRVCLRWDKKPEEEKQLIMDNRECYCRMHGYDLFIGNDTQVSDGYWAKLMHTKRLLPKVDWLFFADVDFYITQLDRPLTDYIPPEGAARRCIVERSPAKNWCHRSRGIDGHSDRLCFVALSFLGRVPPGGAGRIHQRQALLQLQLPDQEFKGVPPSSPSLSARRGGRLPFGAHMQHAGGPRVPGHLVGGDGFRV